MDLSKVVLTHHHLRNGGVQDKDKVELAEIIAKLNEIFGVGVPEKQLNFSFQVIPTRIKQSSILRQQAAANSKEQFANSPDFDREFMEAIMGALEAHQLMSTRVLNSSEARGGLTGILLDHTNLYEDLRKQGQQE